MYLVYSSAYIHVQAVQRTTYEVTEYKGDKEEQG